MSMRSAGPLISKFRKKALARKRERISSTQSYDSLFGSTSVSSAPEGSGGRVYAGPRVRVRSGRRGKFPVGGQLSGDFACRFFEKSVRPPVLSCVVTTYLSGRRPGRRGRWSGMPRRMLLPASAGVDQDRIPHRIAYSGERNPTYRHLERIRKQSIPTRARARKLSLSSAAPTMVAVRSRWIRRRTDQTACHRRAGRAMIFRPRTSLRASARDASESLIPANTTLASHNQIFFVLSCSLSYHLFQRR